MATRKQTSAKAAPQKVERKPKGITMEEAVRAYQNDPIINSRIAENTLTDGQRLVVEALDSGMKPLKDMALSRVTVPDTIDFYLREAKVARIEELKDKTITHIPFLSVTKNDMKSLVERRINLGLSKTVGIIVYANDKLKGVDVNEVLGVSNGFAQQREVILARGQKFQVRKVTYENACPILHLYAV